MDNAVHDDIAVIRIRLHDQRGIEPSGEIQVYIRKHYGPPEHYSMGTRGDLIYRRTLPKAVQDYITHLRQTGGAWSYTVLKFDWSGPDRFLEQAPYLFTKDSYI